MTTLANTLVFSFGMHPSGRLRMVYATRLYAKSVALSRVYCVPDDDANESILLSEIANFLGMDVHRIAGWDSRVEFMRCFIRRCFVQGVRFEWYFKDRFGPNYRYSDDKHLDLKDFFTNYGTVPMTSYDIPALFGVTREDTEPSEIHDLVVDHLYRVVSTVRHDVVAGKIEPESHDSVLKSFITGLQNAVADRMNPQADVDAVGVSTRSVEYPEIVTAYSTFLREVVGTRVLLGGAHGWH